MGFFTVMGFLTVMVLAAAFQVILLLLNLAKVVGDISKERERQTGIPADGFYELPKKGPE